jgi:hypothetical protein
VFVPIADCTKCLNWNAFSAADSCFWYSDGTCSFPGWILAEGYTLQSLNKTECVFSMFSHFLNKLE